MFQAAIRLSLAAAAMATALAAPPLLAQPAMPAPVKDYKAAPAGAYALDPKHTGLVARVPHLGFSYSIFRFQTVTADLTWDPANPAADKLKVAVDPKSITTAPVDGFSAELVGAKFLNVAQFPSINFVSKSFHPVDATHGTVDGDLTLLGVTKPATFDVVLVGAGKGFRGPVLGVTARTTLEPKAYGLPAFITQPVELIIDTEFDKQG